MGLGAAFEIGARKQHGSGGKAKSRNKSRDSKLDSKDLSSSSEEYIKDPPPFSSNYEPSPLGHGFSNDGTLVRRNRDKPSKLLNSDYEAKYNGPSPKGSVIDRDTAMKYEYTRKAKEARDKLLPYTEIGPSSRLLTENNGYTPGLGPLFQVKGQTNHQPRPFSRGQDRFQYSSNGHYSSTNRDKNKSPYPPGYPRAPPPWAMHHMHCKEPGCVNDPNPRADSWLGPRPKKPLEIDLMGRHVNRNTSRDRPEFGMNFSSTSRNRVFSTGKTTSDYISSSPSSYIPRASTFPDISSPLYTPQTSRPSRDSFLAYTPERRNAPAYPASRYTSSSSSRSSSLR